MGWEKSRGWDFMAIDTMLLTSQSILGIMHCLYVTKKQRVLDGSELQSKKVTKTRKRNPHQQLLTWKKGGNDICTGTGWGGGIITHDRLKQVKAGSDGCMCL